MSKHAIHAREREAVCGWEDGYFLVIIDFETDREIFSSAEFTQPLMVDEVMIALTCYNMPIPRGLRDHLITDGIMRDCHTVVHYYFDEKGVEFARKIHAAE